MWYGRWRWQIYDWGAQWRCVGAYIHRKFWTCAFHLNLSIPVNERALRIKGICISHPIIINKFDLMWSLPPTWWSSNTHMMWEIQVKHDHLTWCIKCLTVVYKLYQLFVWERHFRDAIAACIVRESSFKGAVHLLLWGRYMRRSICLCSPELWMRSSQVSKTFISDA